MSSAVDLQFDFQSNPEESRRDLQFDFQSNPEESLRDPYERDFNYYKNIDKVYWYPLHDIILNDNGIIKANNPTPCIYVERSDSGFAILQFDMSIEFDKWRYTAFRSVLGKSHDINVDVLLIYEDGLYTLDGIQVDIGTLKRSRIWIDKEFLAKSDLK